jgi:glutathione S-transferase
MLGERFSLVDIPSAADLWWYQKSQSLDLGAWPRVQGWVGRTTERPAFKVVSSEL